MNDSIDHGYVRAVALDRLRTRLQDDGFPADVTIYLADLLNVYSDNEGEVELKTVQPIQKKLLEALGKMPSIEDQEVEE